MTVEQAGLTCRPFKKKDRRKGRGYCPIHRTDAHDLTECKVVRGIIDQKLGERKHKCGDNNEDQAAPDQSVLGYQRADHMVHHIFGGAATYSSNREYKSVVREVWATASDPSPRLKWLEVPLTFSQVDHPVCVRRPGRYPIVVEPTVQNIRLGRVLVDSGSSINLLFADALNTLQIPRSSLKPFPPFFRITPGSSVKPLGQIELPITFSLLDNFWTERVLFDVADFETAYNTILGRPTMT